MRWSALLAVPVLFGCEVPAAPILVNGSERFEPPPVYQLWWDMTQRCSGRQGMFTRVRWYFVPGTQTLTVNGQRVAGYWTAPNTIVLAEAAMVDGSLVRHEMLHALQNGAGHPREFFLSKCGGVVLCDGPCAADAEPLAPPDAGAARVGPEALEVYVDVNPQTPSRGAYGGFFTLTVTARNPQSHSVVVTLPPTTFGEPSASFEYRMQGAVAADGRAARAIDEGVTRFAPGESKRHVFDFHMFDAAGSAGSGLGPGSYTFTGAYGGRWAPVSRTVTLP